MPGSIPATSQLDWLISTTAMIVLSWSRATRDLLKSFGWGIGALHRLATATMVPSPRRLPHSISGSHPRATSPAATRFVADSALERAGFEPLGPPSGRHFSSPPFERSGLRPSAREELDPAEKERPFRGVL